MYEVIQSTEFVQWFDALKDRAAKARIQMRIDRAEAGNLGDYKPLREGVSEMRIDVGAGCRVYFTKRENILVILLSGGDKSTQRNDINRAIELAKVWS